MNWLKRYITKNNILWLTGSVAGAAALIAGFPVAAGIALPAGVVAAATKVAGISTLIGMVAMKLLPGSGSNAPSAGPGQKADAEDPK